jgi:phenylacetate-CoA ligase
MTQAGSLRRSTFEAKLAVARRDERADYRELCRNEHLSPASLDRLQRRRTVALLQDVATSSPYYRDRFAERGLSAADLADPAVFDSLPVLTKADVRDNFAAIRTTGHAGRTAHAVTTGGSTGHPLKVLHPADSHHRTLDWRTYRWWGSDPSQNAALVWRGKPRNHWKRLRHDVLWWPARRAKLDTNQLDEASMTAFLDRVDRIRPTLLFGYVGGMLELARFMQASERRIPRPAGIAVTAAPVTAAQKRFLSEVFGAPCYDAYSCVEVPVIAAECARQEGLHVLSDVRRVELLDDDDQPVGPGELGNVVVTDLKNRAFPLVRYKVGDKARWRTEPCSCGMSLPLLGPVQGRISDALRLPSGRMIAGEGMISLFNRWPDAVRQFQLRQHGDASLTLRCVPGADPRADEIMQQVVAGLRSTVRGEVPVRLDVVETILSDRGKSRFIVREGADPVVPVQAAAPAPVTSRNEPFATS